MLLDAVLSWLHFLLAFLLVGALVAQLFILRLQISEHVARLLRRVDLFYGGSAGLLVLAGVLRVLFGDKSWEYYVAQPFFWAKMAAFGFIAALSIVPTLSFRRWVGHYAQQANFAPALVEVKRVRGYVNFEVHAVAFLVAFAALMARGVWIG